MNRILSILLILVARGSFGQMSKVGYTAMTVADLENRDPVSYERVEVIHGATNCLWEHSRFFIHDPFSSATPIRGYVLTNKTMSGRYVATDLRASEHDIRNFLAVGDGVTDNADAIGAALSLSRNLVVPRGRYALSMAPRITNAESISIVSRDGAYQGGWHSTNLVTKAEFLYTGPPTNIFFDFQPGLDGGSGRQMLRLGNLVENVSFNANGLADTCVRIGYLGRGRFIGCRFNGATGVNWLLNASQFCTFIDCSTSRNEDPMQTVTALYGMSLTNFCPVNMFIDCQFENSSLAGVHLAPNSKNNIFSGGAIEANQGDGLILESGADANSFTGTWFEANGGTNSIWIKAGAIHNSFTSLRSFEDNVLGTLRVAGSYNSFKNFGAHTIWIEPSGTRNKWESMIWVTALIDQTAGGQTFIDMIDATATIRTNTFSAPVVQYGEPFKLWNGTNLYERTRLAYDGIYFGDGSNPARVGWTRFGSSISTTNSIISFPQGANDSLYTAYVVGDSQPRVRIYPNQIQFGPGGTNEPDVFWKRNGASNLITEAEVWNYHQNTNDIAWATVLPGNAHLPFTIRGDGRIDFGSGAVARDASIERTGVGEITIRTNVVFPGLVTIGGVPRNTWPTDAGTLDGQDGAWYLARSNHTGTQDWSTITGTPTTMSGYGITDGPFLPLSAGTNFPLTGLLLIQHTNPTVVIRSMAEPTYPVVSMQARSYPPDGTFFEIGSASASDPTNITGVAMSFLSDLSTGAEFPNGVTVSGSVEATGDVISGGELFGDGAVLSEGIRLFAATSASYTNAPGLARAHVFLRQNGGGKGELCVRFPSGSVQVIATEP
jgi:hypothetical protein